MGGVTGCGSFFGMSDFKKLVVWQKAHALALHAHRAAMGIRESRYASLRSQIIRSAMSIPTNIVEGRRQETNAILRDSFAIASTQRTSWSIT
jgi:four helix bundle protein